MTSEEQADARQRIEICIKAAALIESASKLALGLDLDCPHDDANRVRALQIQKQLAVVAKLLRNRTDDPRRNQPED